mgnify:CR=1 FL=1
MVPLVLTSLTLMACGLRFEDRVVGVATWVAGATSCLYWYRPISSGFDSWRLKLDYTTASVLAMVLLWRVAPNASLQTWRFALCTAAAFAASNVLGFHQSTPHQRAVHGLAHVSLILLLCSGARDASGDR